MLRNGNDSLALSVGVDAGSGTEDSKQIAEEVFVPGHSLSAFTITGT
jgi:hypothetical protein